MLHEITNFTAIIILNDRLIRNIDALITIIQNLP